jgi:uncharacterized phage protein (TIGR02218 family)
VTKTISPALKTHLQQDVTTMATCWDITRTDGVILGFTDHDQDLVVSGITYKASTGYTRTAIKSDQTMAVDNIDVLGILDSAEIKDVDLIGGRYNGATFHIFAVNWADLTQDRIRNLSGTFGEVESLPTGTYKVELRGLTQYLVTEVAFNYQPLCRADLGDTKCKVPIRPGGWAPAAGVAAGTVGSISGTYVSDPAAADDTHALAVYQCITGGTTALSAPAFDPVVGHTTTEST